MVSYALPYLQTYGLRYPVCSEWYLLSFLFLVILFPVPTFSYWWFCTRNLPSLPGGSVPAQRYILPGCSLRGTYLPTWWLCARLIGTSCLVVLYDYLPTWWFCTRLIGISYLVVLYVEPTLPSYMVVLYPAHRYILPGSSLRGTYLPTLVVLYPAPTSYSVVLNPAHGYGTVHPNWWIRIRMDLH